MAGAAIVAACSSPGDVEVERADAIVGELRPDIDTIDGASPEPEAGGEAGDGPVGGEVDTSSVAWGTCDGFGIPEVEVVGSANWECGRIEVAMNPDDPNGGLPPVSLAVTRHRATGDRFGAIVVNPGGPGGAGLPLAWNLRPALPPELLRGFDVVSWDPRGIGQSEPVIGCPADALPDDTDFIERCVETTGPLSAFLAAPYSVADMESLRVALGEDRLDYLGYSYGSILGAGYAARYPEHVGSFVLDGVTDPDVGSIDGPISDGFPNFADNGFPAALDRFHELCETSSRCLPGASDTADTVDEIKVTASELPTDDYAPEPQELTAQMVDEYLDYSMRFAGEWELVAAALNDASDGDGSKLAAHVDATDFIVPGDDGDDGDGAGGGGAPDDGAAPDNFEAANFMIYCADLGPFVTWSFCGDMPVAADPLRRVEPVELDRPILVIGTEFDPITPGYHAAEMADRLGDAAWMIWEGVGHTAFPGWTRCIDDAVTDQFLGRVLVESGTSCSFFEGVTSDVEIGDELFGFGIDDGRPWVENALEFHGRADDATAECVARAVVPDDLPDDGLVADIILDVRSADADAVVEGALAGC